MVNTRSAQHGSPQQGRGRGQLPSGNPPSHTTPPPTTQPQHIEGTGENNPNLAENLNPIASQLNIMQQQLDVFQLVLAQLLARDNPGDPLIALLNPTNQIPTQQPQHNMTSPARTATLPRNNSPAHSHMAPLPQPPPQPAISDLPKGNSEKILPENRTPQTPALPSSTPIPTPLNSNILQEPYPSGFRMPQLETYDGTKDPDDHLHAFCSVMQAQNASDALICKIFPSTLRGNARTWYYSLQPDSISSYAELTAFFATKFSSRRLIKKTTSELMRVTQREGESLKNYMNRFNDAVLEISSFNHGVGLAALIAGLKHDRFRDSLIKHAPAAFDEANERSWKFIQAEEYALSGKATPSKEVRPPAWRDEGQNRKRFKPAQNRGPFPSRDHYHTTEECQSLKSELEGLARKGMLNEYVSKGDQPKFVREQGRPQAPREASNRVGVGYQQAPPPLPPPSRIIHMITGGLEAGGISSKQQKLYVREVKHQNRVQKRKFDETDWKNQPITFSAVDFDGVITPHNDPLVTSVIVNNCEVHRILVDTGSAPDIMYYHSLESLSLDSALLQKYDGPIYGFNNQPVPVEGILTLKVAFGSGRTYVTPSVRFLVVKMASSFNIVIGRPTLTEIRAVVSQSHICMKFPTPMGVATLRGNQEVARHSYMTSVTLPWRDKLVTPAPIQSEMPPAQQVMGIELPDNKREGDARATPTEEVEEIQLDPNDPTRKTQIGTKLNPEEREELIDFLKSNRDVFAWTSADMPWIPASVAVHKLGTNPLKKPVTQKRRLFRGERLQAIKEEVQKLLQAGFIRRVDYCEWVTNPVLVKKLNGKWRLCIDYTNLNEACPKDYHPLPNIDKLVEAASGNERLSLLNAYSGYHQVHMAPEDEVKTSFYAGDEIYYYVMMPFGLKNAGATYQKMVTIVFRAQIGRNLEVYVDDIVVKSLRAEDHLTDLGETFDNLRRHIMKLNLAKCVFGVESGKFLGFLVSRRGIEVNPEKIKAIEEMKPPKSIKDVQRLTGQVAALHRKAKPGNPESLSGLRSAKPLSKSSRHTSAHPPINQSRRGGDTLPLPRNLRYSSQLGFDKGNSTVTEASLLCKQSAVGGRIETDFAETRMFRQAHQVGSRVGRVPDHLSAEVISLSKGAGAGAVLIGPEHFRSKHALKFNFEATNNMAEYEALLLGIRLAAKLKVTSLQDGTVPIDKQEELKLRRKASRYALLDGILYKTSYSLPLLRCLTPYEAEYALREVHEGVCGSHVRARTLAHKVLRQGYYWPNMQEDATQFVQKCQKCQFFAHLTHQPAEELTNLVAPWPFAQWGLDLLGPFVKGVGGVTHLVVAVDYFTKWVKARPLSSLTSRRIEDFVFSAIICRYGITNRIVTDNGPQFNCTSFRDFCSSYGIKLLFTSVYHPETNGMVESVNKAILEGIKPRLDQLKAKWADELNNVLWAYRTTTRTATGETPYHLAFGTKAVIPIELGVPSLRVSYFDSTRNDLPLREDLDLLDEVREQARLRTIAYKQKIANFYNKRV
ncbi:hypothetical protein SLEP1_g18276 [Rubroshorea leprosula]|uniref:Integrase catalytic domain-containing protein n=1 Tax=Rubroshorea leprosula TaxID=152421 RepID=A0AAV5J5V2_9ROSI|nr:hypothetical protein SLEP1_g18276 [Rubroshorea leprosula]